MLYLSGEKYVKKVGSANRKSTNYKICKSQKGWVRQWQIGKLPHFWKVRKSNKLLKSAILQICDLRTLFSYCPPLMLCNIACKESGEAKRSKQK